MTSPGAIAHTLLEVTIRCPKCDTSTIAVVELSGAPGEHVARVAEIQCSGCPQTLGVPVDAVLR